MKILIISLSKISLGFLKGVDSLKIKPDVYSPNSSLDDFNCYNKYEGLKGVYKYIFLGCKPQHLEDVAKKLPKTVYNNDTIFISVLAGVSSKMIAKKFAVQKVFRVMPSLAFEFGNSFIASFAFNMSESEINNVTSFFGDNHLIHCKSDNEIDEFTAIYGSGMGFVFETMSSFMSAGGNMLDAVDKRELLVNLFENAAIYLKRNSDVSFTDAVQNVASKGGTTEAGLTVLRKNNALEEIFKDAIQAALKRANELSNA